MYIYDIETGQSSGTRPSLRFANKSQKISFIVLGKIDEEVTHFIIAVASSYKVEAGSTLTWTGNITKTLKTGYSKTAYQIDAELDTYFQEFFNFVNGIVSGATGYLTFRGFDANEKEYDYAVFPITCIQSPNPPGYMPPASPARPGTTVNGLWGAVLLATSGGTILVPEGQIIKLPGVGQETFLNNLNGHVLIGDEAENDFEIDAENNRILVPDVSSEKSGLMTTDLKDMLEGINTGIQSLTLYGISSSSAIVGALSTTRSTISGTVVPVWGGALTTVERQLFGFQITTTFASTALPGNIYRGVFPLQNLATNRTYRFRVRLTVQHSTINSGVPVVLVDQLVNPLQPVSSAQVLIAEYPNQQSEALNYPTGSVIDIQLWGSVTVATGPLSILVNDKDTALILVRNEYLFTGVKTLQGVFGDLVLVDSDGNPFPVDGKTITINAGGGDVTAAGDNTFTGANTFTQPLTVDGNLVDGMYPDDNPLDACQAYDVNLRPYTWLDGTTASPKLTFKNYLQNLQEITFLAKSDNAESSGNARLVAKRPDGTEVARFTVAATPTAALRTLAFDNFSGALEISRDTTDALDTLPGAIKIYALSTWRAR